MPKVKKCYQSALNARPPKCYKGGPSGCPSCVTALALYEQVKAFRVTQRMLNNRASAAKSRDNKVQKNTDLHSDNLALTEEHDNLVQELADLDQASAALAQAIANKIKERHVLSQAKQLRAALSLT